MTRKRNEFLAKLNQARGVLNTQDPTYVALVKSVYDALLFRFGDPEVLNNLTNEDYLTEWNTCRDDIMRTLDANCLIPLDTFTTIWNAYDIIVTVDTTAFA